MVDARQMITIKDYRDGLIQPINLLNELGDCLISIMNAHCKLLYLVGRCPVFGTGMIIVGAIVIMLIIREMILHRYKIDKQAIAAAL